MCERICTSSLTKPSSSAVPTLNGNWRGWAAPLPWLAAQGCPRRWKRIERKESPAGIWCAIGRDLGRSGRKTRLASCCDQRRKEARRFPDRQVSTEGTEKAKVEAVILGHQWN